MISKTYSMNQVSKQNNHDGKERELKSELNKKSRTFHESLHPNGTHSSIRMRASGLLYNRAKDTVRCDQCDLEVSDLSEAMDPIQIHFQRSPKCPYILGRLSRSIVTQKSTNQMDDVLEHEPSITEYEGGFLWTESRKIQEARRRTFSHWPSRMKPSAAQMIVAGFFSCNVSDRTICLYCNLICQQWSPDGDEPSEVHKTLSPQCPFVLSVLNNQRGSSALIINDVSGHNRNGATLGPNSSTRNRFAHIDYTSPCHLIYSDITKRLESFERWTAQSAPSIEDLTRAGFFYTGTGTIVTCFYCDGSLQNWGANDQPAIEHVRWFEHCVYARQLCGEELCQRIQLAKRAQQERNRPNTTNDQPGTSENQPNSLSSNPNLLARHVAARLDLESSQNLLNQRYKLPVIRRCWEDQLKLKGNDFMDDIDLVLACIILQKQIDHIQGRTENITIPSVQMGLMRRSERVGLSSSTSNQEIVKDITERLQAQPVPNMETSINVVTPENLKQQQMEPAREGSLSNPCLICCREEKRLACIPCGHFAACVSCSHSLKTCPICRKAIEAFVRIYI